MTKIKSIGPGVLLTGPELGKRKSLARPTS